MGPAGPPVTVGCDGSGAVSVGGAGGIGFGGSGVGIDGIGGMGIGLVSRTEGWGCWATTRIANPRIDKVSFMLIVLKMCSEGVVTRVKLTALELYQHVWTRATALL